MKELLAEKRAEIEKLNLQLTECRMDLDHSNRKVKTLRKSFEDEKTIWVRRETEFKKIEYEHREFSKKIAKIRDSETAFKNKVISHFMLHSQTQLYKCLRFLQI